jgi:hypothetical protein
MFHIRLFAPSVEPRFRDVRIAIRKMIDPIDGYLAWYRLHLSGEDQSPVRCKLIG